jgi:hypothetical protein
MEKIEEKKKEIEIILTNLQVIGSINKYEKLICKNSWELDVDKRYLQSVRRFFSGDSREAILNFLSKLFSSIDSEVHFLLTSYKSSKSESLHEYVTNTLHDFYINTLNAKKGISNLIETYSDDIAVKSKLELYFNMLDRKSLSLKHKLGIRDESFTINNST